MIKSDIEQDNSTEEAPKEILQFSGLLVLSIGLLIVVGIIFSKYNSSQPQLGANSNSKYVSALPLSTASTTPITSFGASQSTTTNSNSDPSLSTSTVDIQNNLPEGKGTSTTNGGLQPSTTGQSTGQTINPNLPY